MESIDEEHSGRHHSSHHNRDSHHRHRSSSHYDGDDGDVESVESAASSHGSRGSRGSRETRSSSHGRHHLSSHGSGSNRKHGGSQHIPDDIARDLRSDYHHRHRSRHGGAGHHGVSTTLHGGGKGDKGNAAATNPVAKRPRTWNNVPANNLTFQEVWRRVTDPTSWWCVGAATLLAFIVAIVLVLYFKSSLVLDHSNTPKRGSLDWKKVLAVGFGVAAVVFGGATLLRFKLLK